MKREILIIGVIVLIISLSLSGCDNGTTNGGNNDVSDLDGTWISTTTIDGTNYLKLVASNGSFNEYMASSKTATKWKEVVRGTYPNGAKSPIKATITEVNTFMFGGVDEWKSYDDLGATNQGHIGSKIQTIAISGNKFTANGLTFEKLENVDSDFIYECRVKYVSGTRNISKIEFFNGYTDSDPVIESPAIPYILGVGGTTIVFKLSGFTVENPNNKNMRIMGVKFTFYEDGETFFTYIGVTDNHNDKYKVELEFRESDGVHPSTLAPFTVTW